MLIRSCKATRRIALLVGFVCAMGAAPAGAVTPIVTSHGTLAAPATGLTTATDGALWHTSRGEPPRVGRTNLAGRTVEVALDANARPGAIVTGPDSAMWIADERGAVLRLGADATAQTVREFDDATPAGLATGPDGNLWVTLAAASADRRGIGRLTPEGELTVFGESQLSGSPAEIAVGWDGALWFTVPSAARIGRVTTGGVLTEFPVADAPRAIAAGPDGAMWFTTGRDGIGRIAVDGDLTMYTDGLSKGDRPGDIALGIDGALWFTLHKEIGRINAAGGVTKYPVGDRRPEAIVAGTDRAMWFTDAKSRTLGRLGAAAAPSTPVLGETFVGAEKRGTVRIRTPASRKSVPLNAAATLPFGAVIDATAGALKVRTAVPGGGTQTGTFFGGRFKIVQSPRAGMVRIALRGRLDCAKRRGSIATVSRKRRKRRRVWGQDGGGLFETLGLNSITTVRGTRWLTEDRCNGTLTRVTEGSVVVRDRGTGKRIVLKAGQRYFARRR